MRLGCDCVPLAGLNDDSILAGKDSWFNRNKHIILPLFLAGTFYLVYRAVKSK